MRILFTGAIVVALLPFATCQGAVPQFRIVTFKPTGELSWTNFAMAGAYKVQWANSPSGPWNAFSSRTNLNLILAKTNRVTVEVPVSDQAAFYRVAWVLPGALGVWDYYGSNSQGGLFATGQVTFTAERLTSTNPSRPYYQLKGTWNFQCAGPPTNWCYYPAIGSGSLGGGLDVAYAELQTTWPTNVADGNMEMYGTIWGNTWTGRWYYSANGPSPLRGTFLARKR